MLTIAPNTLSRLYYQLPQPWDTATYYVRAVVKDLLTNTILGTYDLDSLGSQAFSKEWTTPADNSGQGRQLVVTFTVYEDSGYTQPSPNYGTQAEYYTIYQPWTQVLGNIGGGSVNYEEIRRVLEKVLAKQKPAKTPVFSDWGNRILEQIKSLVTSVAGLQESDSKVHGLLDSIPRELKSIKSEVKSNAPDLSIVSSEIAELRNSLRSLENLIKQVESGNARMNQDGFRRLEVVLEKSVPVAVRRYMDSLGLSYEEPKAKTEPIPETVETLPKSPRKAFLEAFANIGS